MAKKKLHKNPPAKETEKIVGYKPETLLKAPLEPPRDYEAPPDEASKHSREIRKNHNVFGLFLVLAGVGLLVLLALAVVFLPSVATSWLVAFGIIGLTALVIGLIIDSIYRASYNRNGY